MLQKFALPLFLDMALWGQFYAKLDFLLQKFMFDVKFGRGSRE